MGRRKHVVPQYRLVLNSRGLWVVRATIDGKTRDKATGQRDRAAAEAFAPGLMRQLQAPRIAPGASLKAVCEAYIEHRGKVITHPQDLRHNLDPVIEYLGTMQPSDITDTTAQQFAQWRLQQKPRTRGGTTVSPSTVIKNLAMMRAAVAWAVRNKLITSAGEFEMPISKGAPKDRWLSRDEAERLLHKGCIGAPHIALAVRLAIGSAQRRAAILGLPWANVQLPEQMALEWYNDVERGIEYERLTKPILIDFGAGVGNKRRARLALPDNPGLYRALVEAKKVAKTAHVIEYEGKTVRDIKTGLIRAFERAELEPSGFHIFRHTALTWCVLAGMSYERIGKMFAVSAEMVEKVYGHHDPRFIKEAGNVLSL